MTRLSLLATLILNLIRTSAVFGRLLYPPEMISGAVAKEIFPVSLVLIQVTGAVVLVSKLESSPASCFYGCR